MANSLRLVRGQWWLITIFVLVAISVLSLTPLPHLPQVPGSDKTHHILAYAVLMLPAFLASYKIRLYLFLAFFAWSGVIEIVQPFVNRHGELLDLLANFLGLSIGALLGRYCRAFL